MAEGLITAAMKAIYSRWNLTQPLYFNHVPSEVEYPFVIYNIISSPRFHSMGNSGKAWNYADIRVQFTVFANEDGTTVGRTIVDAINDLYDQASITISGKNFVCCMAEGEGISFFNSEEKVWQFVNDYKFTIGE